MTPEEPHADPRNWSRGLSEIYFARDDPRLWVKPRGGGTFFRLNMAHARAMPLLIGTTTGLTVFVSGLVRHLF